MLKMILVLYLSPMSNSSKQQQVATRTDIHTHTACASQQRFRVILGLAPATQQQQPFILYMQLTFYSLSPTPHHQHISSRHTFIINTRLFFLWRRACNVNLPPMDDFLYKCFTIHGLQPCLYTLFSKVIWFFVYQHRLTFSHGMHSSHSHKRMIKSSSLWLLDNIQ